MSNDLLKDLGVGVSWGFGGVRIGRSGYGSWWISVGIPRTGIRFSKVIYRPIRTNSSNTLASGGSSLPVPPGAVSAPITSNQEIVQEMERLTNKKP
jgi:hypothetical protein